MKRVKYITTKIIGVYVKNICIQMERELERWRPVEKLTLTGGHNEIFTFCSVYHCITVIFSNLEYIHVLSV